MCEAAFKTFNDGKTPSLPLLKVKDNYPYFLETGNGPTLANPAAGDIAALVSRMSQLKQ